MIAALFDLDGTLTDPREGITRSLAYALERMGVAPPPLDEMVFAIGPPLRASLAQLLGTDSPAAVERALALYRERFADVGLFENRPYEGVAEALAALSAGGVRLLVATSKPTVYARRIVERFALAAHFEEVHGCELDGTREDKRELLAHVIPRHRLDASASVMIGDRGADMRAARHHGLHALGALWGYGTDEELREAGAHGLCAAPSELPALLSRTPR
ncbi:MAG TPA: HAD hydrolase-like protein [Usitatibacter sp.]|nr:HAD hydrolase-like protein [Usitatibacter sp.]